MGKLALHLNKQLKSALLAASLISSLLVVSCTSGLNDDTLDITKEHNDKVANGEIPAECLNIRLNLSPITPIQVRSLITCMNQHGSQASVVQFLNELKTLNEDLLETLLDPMNEILDSTDKRTLILKLFDAVNDLDESKELENALNSFAVLLKPNSTQKEGMLETGIEFLKNADEFDKKLGTSHLDQLLETLSSDRSINHESLIQIFYDVSQTQAFKDLVTQFSNRFKPIPTTLGSSVASGLTTTEAANSISRFFHCGSSSGTQTKEELIACQNKIQSYFTSAIDFNVELIMNDEVLGRTPEEQSLKVSHYSGLLNALAKDRGPMTPSSSYSGERFLDMLTLTSFLNQDIVCGKSKKVNLEVEQQNVFDHFAGNEIEAKDFFIRKHPTQFATATKYCSFGSLIKRSYPTLMDIYAEGHHPAMNYFTRAIKLDQNKVVREDFLALLSEEILGSGVPIFAELGRRNAFSPALTIIANLKGSGRAILADTLSKGKPYLPDLIPLLQSLKPATWESLLNYFDKLINHPDPLLANLLPAAQALLTRTGVIPFAPLFVQSERTQTTLKVLKMLLSPMMRKALFKAIELPSFEDALKTSAYHMTPASGVTAQILRLGLWAKAPPSTEASRVSKNTPFNSGDPIAPTPHSGSPDAPGTNPKNFRETYEACRVVAKEGIGLIDINQSTELPSLLRCFKSNPERFESVLGDLISELSSLVTPGSSPSCSLKNDYAAFTTNSCKSYLEELITFNNPLLSGDMLSALLEMTGEVQEEGQLKPILDLLNLAIEHSPENLGDYSQNPDPVIRARLENTTLFKSTFQLAQSLWLTKDLGSGPTSNDVLSQIIDDPNLEKALTYLQGYFETPPSEDCTEDHPTDLKNGEWPKCFNPTLPVVEDPNHPIRDQIRSLGDEYKNLSDEEILEIEAKIKYEFQNRVELEEPGKLDFTVEEWDQRIDQVLKFLENPKIVEQMMNFFTEGKGIERRKKGFSWRASSAKLAKFMVDHSLSPSAQHVILYWYPGEKSPRPRLATDLDILLLLLLNGDHDIKPKIMSKIPLLNRIPLIGRGLNVSINSMYDQGMAGRDSIGRVLKTQKLLGNALEEASKYGQFLFGKEFRRKMWNTRHNFDKILDLQKQGELGFLQGLFLAMIYSNDSNSIFNRYVKSKSNLTLLLELSKISWLRGISFLAEPLAGKDLAEKDLFNRTNRVSDFEKTPLAQFFGLLSDPDKEPVRNLLRKMLIEKRSMLHRTLVKAHSELLNQKEEGTPHLRNGLYQLVRGSQDKRFADINVVSDNLLQAMDKAPQFTGDYLPQLMDLLALPSIEKFLRQSISDLPLDGSIDQGSAPIGNLTQIFFNSYLLSDLAERIERVYTYPRGEEFPYRLIVDRFMASASEFHHLPDVQKLDLEALLASNIKAVRRQIDPQTKPRLTEPKFKGNLSHFLRNYPLDFFLFLTIQNSNLTTEVGFNTFFGKQGEELMNGENGPLLKAHNKFFYEVSPMLRSGEIENTIREMKDLLIDL